MNVKILSAAILAALTLEQFAPEKPEPHTPHSDHAVAMASNAPASGGGRVIDVRVVTKIGLGEQVGVTLSRPG